jgi:peptidyl-prolyl cis-trans isomerase SurA
MNKIYSLSLSLILLLLISTPLLAQNQTGDETLDQIVAVVNDHVILKSDVDQQVTDYMMQVRQQNNEAPTFNKELWYSVLQSMVERFVLLDKAKEDSVTVTDEQVNQQIDNRINQYVNQIGSEAALEQEVGKSIVQLRAELREDYRTEMVVSQYRQQRLNSVDITRPEVRAYYEKIPRDSLPTIPERVAVSQIVATPPPLEDAREEALKLARQLRDSVMNHEKSIEELARRHSDGPSAPSGGALGMIAINDLVPEYSAAASALEPGEISKVVETSFGFHIIRLNKRQGDQIDTNHILLSMNDENYDDQAAINKLEQFRDSIMTHEDVTFSEIAREHSEDPNTAPQGGRILNPQTGERLIPLNQLDPALYRIVLLLKEEGDISEPKEFNIGNQNNTKKAYRIVRLDRSVPEHVANLEQDYERIKSAALQQKQMRVIEEWISNLRDEVYIEYKIPIPENYKQS